MEEATKKLLEECSKGCRMAVGSMEQVERYVTGDRMESVLCDYRKKHEQIGKKADHLLKKDGEQPAEPGMAATAMSWMTTEMKMKLNDDDSQVTTLMMNGCNTGIQSISRALHENDGASHESKALARELVQTEEAFMQDLKQFL